jgi:hypothetical protein
MLKGKLVLVAAIPLLWSSFALAQAPAQADPLAQAPAQTDSKEYGEDASEWHTSNCTEYHAIRAAHLAYLEVKLNLTDQQRDLWNKWRQAKLDAATQYRAACIEHQAKEKRLTAVEWEARREKFLTTELHQVQVERPALVALYDALTPEQKILFDEAHRHHPGWGHHRHERHERDGGGARE